MSNFKEKVLFLAPFDEVLTGDINTMVWYGYCTLFKYLSESYDIASITGHKILNPDRTITVPIKPRDQSNRLKSKIIDEFFSTINTSKYKYVILSCDEPILLPSILKYFAHAKIYFWYHNTIYYPNQLIYAETNYHYAKKFGIKILTASNSDKKDLHEKLKWKIKGVLPPYLGTDDYPSKYFKAEIPKDNEYKIIYPGRIADDNYILEMINMINNMPEKFTLDICGPSHIQPNFYKKFLDIIKDNPKVNYLGSYEHEDLLNLLSNYKCILGRLMDSFGVANYEAARLGLTIAAPIEDKDSNIFLYGNEDTTITYQTSDKDNNESMYLNLGNIIAEKWDSIDKKKNLEYTSQFNSSKFNEILRSILSE